MDKKIVRIPKKAAIESKKSGLLFMLEYRHLKKIKLEVYSYNKNISSNILEVKKIGN